MNPSHAARRLSGVALLLPVLLGSCGQATPPPDLEVIPWGDLEVGVTRTLREVTDLLEQQPEEPALWQELGLRLAAHQLDRAGEACLEYALTLDATLIEAASASADLARFGGKPLETVLSRYNRALELDPLHAPLWMGRGDAFADAGRLTEAEESYRRALELWPDLLRAQSRLGRVLVQREAYEEGMGLLEPLVQAFPDDVPCATSMAQALAAVGRLEEAAALAEQARGGDGEKVPLQDPRRIDMLSRQRASWYLFQRARASLDRQDLPRAAMDLAAALEGQPEAYNARALLARTLLALRRIPEAEEQLRLALETKPGHPESLRLLGQVVHQQGFDRQAVELLEQAAAREPLDPGSSLALGSSYLRLNDPQASLPHLEAAAQGSPELADAWLRLAVARRDVGDRSGSQEAAQKGIALDPEHPLAAALEN